jgi:hypothetical protein
MTWQGNAGQVNTGHDIACSGSAGLGLDMVSHYIACHGTIQRIKIVQIQQSRAEQSKNENSEKGRKHSAARRPTVTAQALKHIPYLPCARPFISSPYYLCSRMHLQSYSILLSYHFASLCKVLHRYVIIIPYSAQLRLWPWYKSLLSGYGLPSVTFHPTTVTDADC